MKRLLTIAALLSLVLATSAALAAPPAGKDKEPQSAADTKAEKACKAERGTTSASMTAFNEKYGTNKNKKNAFGKCVSSKSKDDDERGRRKQERDERLQEVQGRARHDRGEHRSVRGEVRDEQEQEERAREVRLEVRESEVVRPELGAPRRGAVEGEVTREAREASFVIRPRPTARRDRR